MYQIMLCCSAGMSTSLLVTKMRTAAEEQEIDVQIDAYSVSEFEQQVGQYQVVLIGPQVKYLKDDLTQRAQPFGVPVDVIGMSDYGMQNGKNVLAQAIELIQNKA
ncbi:PTS sugar transporter subunit IIB [Celerinatantimonas diazotrophica]|uniref:PTS system cellobiose-specific IIB component n=1 Tax=Celerinatantimonas diazotrophica TaxID=412034 RepID=A0A4R1K4I1_9GAMM|nr:PTS sugar transporter subunit IIB [Celerinatantimonas diazotrophica]TCK59022.1 PTS system cellobiose-specific IIB component [Celerinatantimonas diazotrophica]CAG9297657.1 PTS system cellobiose-specific EIIB component [Celerinatantimonas diazotrophica]